MYQAQKGKGEKKGRKARKRQKGKGAPAVRAIVFVFSELPVSPQCPSIFPFLPIPYPFRRLPRRLKMYIETSS